MVENIDAAFVVKDSGLAPAQIAGLSLATLNNFSPTQIGEFSPTQVQALTAGQLNGMSAANLDVLDVSQLTAEQFNGLTTALSKFTANQLAELNSSQIATKIGSFSASAIAGLTPSEVRALTTAQLNALTSSQVASLLANQANNLSIAQISTFTTSQLSATTLVGAANGLQFNLSWNSSVGNAPTGYRNAVIAAAAGLSATFSNPVVLNIQIGYGEVAGQSIAPSNAAESATFYDSVSYSALKTALQADAGNSSYQATADASLSASNPTNGTFALSTAEAKGLGLTGASSHLDGYVGASSAISFAFNQTASTGKFDAIGVLQHEFAEIMGRVGSVGAAVGAGVYTPLDLFRYTSTNNANPSAGTPVRALMQQGANTDYFSLDGGNTNLGDYNPSNSTVDYADWSASMGADPFGYAQPGITQPMSGNDAIELAAIGWDLTANGTTLAQSATNKPLV